MKRSGTRRPWSQIIILNRARKARNINGNYSALSELHGHCAHLPGATRLTLFGACPWLSYSAPLALNPALIFRAFGAKSGFHIPRLWRFISEFFCKATKPTERRVFRTHAFSVSDLPYTHHRCCCSGQSITETHRDDYGYGMRGLRGRGPTSDTSSRSTHCVRIAA